MSPRPPRIARGESARSRPRGDGAAAGGAGVNWRTGDADGIDGGRLGGEDCIAGAGIVAICCGR